MPSRWQSFALSVTNGAYITEFVRGGNIESKDRGQMRAARSLGMSYGLAMAAHSRGGAGA